MTGDSRKGNASIDTLMADVYLTARDWRGRSRAEQREGVARCIEEDPRKHKLKRGSGPAKGKTGVGVTDRQLDKTLKARCFAASTTRGYVRAKAWPAGCRGKPLKRKILDVVVGRNKLTRWGRSKPSRVRETLRAERKRGLVGSPDSGLQH